MSLLSREQAAPEQRHGSSNKIVVIVTYRAISKMQRGLLLKACSSAPLQSTFLTVTLLTVPSPGEVYVCPHHSLSLQADGPLITPPLYTPTIPHTPGDNLRDRSFCTAKVTSWITIQALHPISPTPAAHL